MNNENCSLNVVKSIIDIINLGLNVVLLNFLALNENHLRKIDLDKFCSDKRFKKRR